MLHRNIYFSEIIRLFNITNSDLIEFKSDRENLSVCLTKSEALQKFGGARVLLIEPYRENSEYQNFRVPICFIVERIWFTSRVVK